MLFIIPLFINLLAKFDEILIPKAGCLKEETVISPLFVGFPVESDLITIP